MHHRKRKRRGCCFADRVKNCLNRRQDNDQVEPLSRKGGGGRVKVCKINGNRKVCARMASMGVYPGAEADIICAENGHQCLLKINGGTVSLDSDVSNNILVTKI